MKRITRVIAIVGTALLAVVLALPFLINVDNFRPLLESNLTKVLAREVKLGDLRLAILSGGVAADDLSVADDPAFSRSPFMRAKSLKVGVELWPLIFSRKLNVTALRIYQPEIVLLQNASGKWNFSTLGVKPPTQEPVSTAAPAKGGLDLSVGLVKILDGRFSVGKATLDDVNVELRDLSANSAFPFSLSARAPGDGEIKIEGRGGPINPADAAMTPVEANLSVRHLDLANSGFLKASSGISGLVSIDGNAISNGHRVQIKSKVKAEKLKLAKAGSAATRPVEFECAVEHELPTQSGMLSRGDIRIGKATASLTGTYNLQGQSPVVNMKLTGPNMPAPELAAMLPALDIVLPAGSSIQGGTASADLTMEGPVNRLVSSGSLGIEKATLAGFDLGAKMSAIERLAGIRRGPNTEIQMLSANLKSAPEGTSVEDIKVVAPAIGELTGAGTISPGHALDFKMRATLHTSGAVMAALGQKSDTSVPFLIQGTSSNPAFKPDMKALVSEKLKGNTGKAARGLLKGLLGGEKKK